MKQFIATGVQSSTIPKVSSDEEEMPKNVLNSVSNDFSSRLNQALLKRPSPSPSVKQSFFNQTCHFRVV